MTRTRVKICGLTRPDEARACHEAGADYLGLVFAGGPRLMDIAGATAVREAAPLARLVGVFADQPADEMAATASACRLDLVQLHGAEPDDVVADVAARTGLPVIKALRAGETASAAADYLLFDLPKGRAPSSGERDRLWREAAAAVAGGRSVFLAGKLSAEKKLDRIARLVSVPPALGPIVLTGHKAREKGDDQE